MKQDKTGKPKVVSLFSGAGGLDLGLEAAGFETVFACDIDEHSCETLAQGQSQKGSADVHYLRKAVIRKVDITKLQVEEIFEATGLVQGEVDLLAGGPPCQAFSVFGKRLGIADARGLLPYEYLRILGDLAPEAFLFENVQGLMTIHGGATFLELQALLANPRPGLSYTLSVFRLDSADYGVPQKRDRIFIIGNKSGKKLASIPKICDASNSKPRAGVGEGHWPTRTVDQAFRGLPALGQLANHYGRKHSERIINRYRSLKLGERDHVTRINKLDPNKPSYTIIVGSDKGGGKGHVHPSDPREVSPRESARIQTFPDDWVFAGKGRHPIRQVGNAVPPLLGAVIGREIIQGFFGRPRPEFKELLRRLGQSHLFLDDM